MASSQLNVTMWVSQRVSLFSMLHITKLILPRQGRPSFVNRSKRAHKIATNLTAIKGTASYREFQCSWGFEPLSYKVNSGRVNNEAS